MKRFLLIVLSSLLLASCGQSKLMNVFSESDTVRLQVGRTEHFIYDANTCQMAFHRDKMQFRAQTDNTSDFFTVNFYSMPMGLSQEVRADISWTTDFEILERKNLTFEVIRLEGEKVWLWSSSSRIGVCLSVF